MSSRQRWLAGLLVIDHENAMGGRMLGVDPQGGVEPAQGFRDLTGTQGDHADLVVDRRIVWFPLQRSFDQRFDPFSVRFQLLDHLPLFRGFRFSTMLGENCGVLMPDGQIARVQADRLGQVADSFLGLFLEQGDFAPFGQGRGIVGMLRQHGIESRLRFVKATEQYQGFGPEYL
jgi:hypothetical protein